MICSLYGGSFLTIDSEERACWVTLHLVPGVGPKVFASLIESFGTARSVLQASVRELEGIHGCSPKVADGIQRSNVDVGRRELALAGDHGAEVVLWKDAEYPSLLKEIHDPPPVLYVKGKLPARIEPSLAVVGSRNATSYGARVTQRLVEGLCGEGVCIVSGMARGIDTKAHWAAVRAEGATLSVWATGLMEVYPQSNAKLAESIEKCGAVLSSFPMEAKAERGSFPARNRLVSGLCNGVLVVEAGSKSGALITAGFALEQGRDVFAVPGDIRSRNSVGTHRLIQQGAKLVHCCEDILEELPMSLVSHSANGRDVLLAGLERTVLDAVRGGTSTLDRLSDETGIGMDHLLGIITTLEMRGAIERSGGLLYAPVS